MIVVYGGRRPSGAGGEFPDSRLEQVHAQLKLLLAGLRPRLIIGSAAAGGDLLVLSASTELTQFDISRQVVLAGGRDDFYRASVADIDDPDQEWTRTFHDVLAAQQTTVTSLEVEPNDAGFAAVNIETVKLGLAQRRNGEPVVGIRVGPRRDRPVPAPDLTAHLAARLRRNNCLVLTVRTDLDDPYEAFVAMPFKTKSLPQRRWLNYNSDVSYERIFVPALVASGFSPRRVDRDNLSELIDSAMIRQLGGAEFVVGDLTTENPNVMWELGIRHAWRPRGTSLVRLENTPIPFDLSRVPVHTYYRGEDDVTDVDLVRSLRELIPAFTEQAAAVGRQGQPDSPVFQHVQGLRRTDLPAPRNQPLLHTVDDLDREIGKASQLRQVDVLQRRAKEVAANPSLPASVSRRLRSRIGYELISLNRLDEAHEILTPLANDDLDLSDVTLQRRYAHTLIRGTGDDLDSRLRDAEYRLEKLLERGADPEASGLLGSAAKVMAVQAFRDGDHAAMISHARRAAKAYEEGFRGNLDAYYPGVNAVALYRLLGQRWDPDNGNESYLALAREILPPVRFVVRNSLRRGDSSIWAWVTDVELDLQEYLLNNPEHSDTAQPPSSLVDSFDELRRKIRGNEQVRDSFTRQLRLMQETGDPAALLRQLVERLNA